LFDVLVIAVTDFDSKSGHERSCLHKEVPSTPHPTIAMESQDALFETAKEAAGKMQMKNERREDTIVNCMIDGVGTESSS